MRHREPSSNSKRRKNHGKTGFMPGIHPEFQVNSISEGYSSAVVSALACQKPDPLVVDADHALGVEVVLIGLMAAAWDCRTKGNMGIRFKETTKHWREMLLNGGSEPELADRSDHRASQIMGRKCRACTAVHRDERFEGYFGSIHCVGAM